MRQMVEQVPTPRPLRRSLSDLPSSELGQISGFSLPDADVAWLEAVGLARGDRIQVLRQAPFGGPLHVRIVDGGELALDRGLASHIDVLPAGMAEV